MDAKSDYEKTSEDIEEVKNELSATLPDAKKNFIEMLRAKIKYLGVRCSILRLKCDKYRSFYDRVQVFIIVLSTMLTLWEAVRSEMELESQVGVVGANFLRCMPVIMASTISLAAGVLKFKNYRTKIDAMTSSIEKVYFVVFSCRRLIEQAIHSTSFALMDDLREKFVNDVHPMFAQCDQQISENLKYRELVKYKRTYLDLKQQMHRDDLEFAPIDSDSTNDSKWSKLLKLKRPKSTILEYKTPPGK
jgi:hypothetical protein